MIKVSGILVPFRAVNDRYGTRWDKDTDFALDLFSPHPVLSLHGKDGKAHGRLTAFDLREDGLWCEGEVNADSPLRALLESGEAAWSSCCAMHMMDVDDTGLVKRWPILEGTLARSDQVVAPTGATKAVTRTAPDDFRSPWLSDLIIVESAELVAPSGSAAVSPARATETATRSIVQPAAALPASDAGVPGFFQSASVASPYDRHSLLAMALHHEANRSIQSNQRSWVYQPEEAFMRAMLDKIERLHESEAAVSAPYPDSPLVKTIPFRALDEAALKPWREFAPNLRANEAMTSTLNNFGDQLVPLLLSSMLYFHVRLESRVLGLFESFEMPSQPFDWPTITSGPTFHAIGEMTDENTYTVANAVTPTSRIGTGKVTFTAGKLSALSLYTEELVQDSGVDFSQAIANEFVRELAHTIDFTLLYGDKRTGTSNVAFDGKASTALSRWLAFDGLLRGTPAGDKVDQSVKFETASILAVLATMGPRGIIGRDLMNLVCLVSPELAYKLDAFDDYATMDNVGEQATLLTGQVGQWRGVPVVVSEDVQKTAVDGNIDNVVAENSTLSYFLVNRSGIKVGLRSRPMVDQQKVPGVDGHFIEVSQRLDVNQLEAGYVGYAYKIGA